MAEILRLPNQNALAPAMLTLEADNFRTVVKNALYHDEYYIEDEWAKGPFQQNLEQCDPAGRIICDGLQRVDIALRSPQQSRIRLGQVNSAYEQEDQAVDELLALLGVSPASIPRHFSATTERGATIYRTFATFGSRGTIVEAQIMNDTLETFVYGMFIASVGGSDE